MALAFILLNSYQGTSNKLSIDYNISGISKTWFNNSHTSTTKKKTILSLEGNLLAKRIILNSLSPVKSMSRKDSIATHNIVNGNESFPNISLISTTLKTDTFYSLENKDIIKEFVVKGTTSTSLTQQPQKGISIYYTMNGTFTDTVRINHANAVYAEKMAYHIMLKVLYKAIFEERKEEIEKIIGLTHSN